MADDMVPDNKPPEPTAVTGSLPVGKDRLPAPAGIMAGLPISADGPTLAADPMWPVKILGAEVFQMVRWLIGLTILLAATFLVWMAYNYTGSKILTVLVWVVLYAPFYFMESRDFWLSRMLGLRVKPNANSWVSAFLFWLLGPVSLFIRPSADPAPLTENEAQMVADPNPAREVAETIVFVVVLVLLLKSFIAEAFVIPTGSMAETLYGYQKIVTCPSCKHVFPVNCSNEVDPQDPPPVPITGCTCPNCRQAIRLIPEDGRRNRMARDDRIPARTGSFPFHEKHPLAGTEYREIVDPGWNNGDRVLVGKFLYEFGSPKPLDVVVFKYPAGPQKNHVPMNYIKRLIGMPEQTIGIYRGDVYALPKEKHTWDYREQDKDIKETDLWDPRTPNPNPHDPRHPDDDNAKTAFEKGLFEIIRKPPAVLLAMQRIVYDNDHQADDLQAKEWQRWVGDSDAWATTNSREFHHTKAGNEADGIDWLKYRHLLRGSGPKPTLITDFTGYNHEEYDGWGYYNPENPREKANWVTRGSRPQDGYNWVGDLTLEAEVQIAKPEGTVIYQLNKGVDRFRLTWDLDAGTILPSRITLEFGKLKEEKLASEPMKAKAGTYLVRFANVDERLTVWVNDDMPFKDGIEYTPPKDKGPVANDLEPAKIGVRGSGDVVIRHVKLWRDTYYIADSNSQKPQDGAGIDDWSDPEKWRAVRSEMPLKTYYVQKGHYLCMGDNSPASSDSRTWGLVPQRLMLGRALMVYWPYSRMGRIR